MLAASWCWSTWPTNGFHSKSLWALEKIGSHKARYGICLVRIGLNRRRWWEAATSGTTCVCARERERERSWPTVASGWLFVRLTYSHRTGEDRQANGATLRRTTTTTKTTITITIKSGMLLVATGYLTTYTSWRECLFGDICCGAGRLARNIRPPSNLWNLLLSVISGI